ncbi:MAG: hypothetical protein FJX71_00410 [Alphaproteobacteria bacterium]|nr:hypothetical protein [Alphaproteobacteria bacterium]
MQLFLLKNLVGASIISMLFTSITVSNLNISENQGLEAKIRNARTADAAAKLTNKIDTSSNIKVEGNVDIRETEAISSDGNSQESFSEFQIAPAPSGTTSLDQTPDIPESKESLQENAVTSSEKDASPISFSNFGVVIKPHSIVPVSDIEKRRSPHLPNDPMDPTKPPLPKPMPTEPTEEEKGFGSLESNKVSPSQNDVRAIRIIRMGEEPSEKGGLTVIKSWNH